MLWRWVVGFNDHTYMFSSTHARSAVEIDSVMLGSRNIPLRY